MKPASSDKIKVIGMMSGTSLDGLDLVAAEFKQNKGKWSFDIIAAETISYSSEWVQKLKTAPSLSGEKLIKLHTEYGRFIGTEINRLIKKTGFTPVIIASHGHTVFHQPEKGFTFQIGNGADIAATTGITTIADFRSGDVALGGQGAPLVPVGDRLLFAEYDYCLNLGGFANISFEKNNQRVAFDISPVNIVLNDFAKKQGFEFDKDGKLGRIGKVNTGLLEILNRIEFYTQPAPKSLGREWVEKEFLPVLEQVEISDSDKMRTIYEHISLQISLVISANYTVLVTGGGAFNSFLIELITKHSSAKIVLPTDEIINFKEALIFAFLGVLKFNGHINCLSLVTGAKKDHSTGVICNSPFDYL